MANECWKVDLGSWDPLVRHYYLAHNNGCCTIYRISCALKLKSERTPLNSFFPLQTFCGKVLYKLRAFRDDGSAARPRLDTSLSQSIPLQVTVFDVALKVLQSSLSLGADQRQRRRLGNQQEFLPSLA